MLTLENIPQISEETLDVVHHEFIYYRDKCKHLDIEFLEYLMKHNMGLVQIIKELVGICNGNDDIYKPMITAIMLLLKTIDIGIHAQTMETKSI